MKTRQCDLKNQFIGEKIIPLFDEKNNINPAVAVSFYKKVRNEVLKNFEKKSVEFGADDVSEEMKKLLRPILLEKLKNYSEYSKLFQIVNDWDAFIYRNDAEKLYACGAVQMCLISLFEEQHYLLKEAKLTALAYLKNPGQFHKDKIKKKMLDQIMNQMTILINAGEQRKTLVLYSIYKSFTLLNFSNVKAIAEMEDMIFASLKYTENFRYHVLGVNVGKKMASISHFLHSNGYSKPLSNTRLLLGRLMDFIEKEALPQLRFNGQIKI